MNVDADNLFATKRPCKCEYKKHANNHRMVIRICLTQTVISVDIHGGVATANPYLCRDKGLQKTPHLIYYRDKGL